MEFSLMPNQSVNRKSNTNLVRTKFWKNFDGHIARSFYTWEFSQQVTTKDKFCNRLISWNTKQKFKWENTFSLYFFKAWKWEILLIALKSRWCILGILSGIVFLCFCPSIQRLIIVHLGIRITFRNMNIVLELIVHLGFRNANTTLLLINLFKPLLDTIRDFPHPD